MKGYVYAIVATAIWSGNFVIARGLSDQIPPVTLAFSRWAVAALVLLPFVVSRLVREWPVVRAHLPYLAVTALLGMTLFNTLIYIAGHTTTALNLTLIAISFPVFVLLLVRLFEGERVGMTRSCGIVAVIAGVLLLITKGDPAVLRTISFSRGDLLMLAAAFVFAVYNLLVKRKPPGLSFWPFQLCTILLGLLFLAPFYAWESWATGPILWRETTVIGVLYAGICASLAAFGLWNNAIFLIGPARAGMLYYTLPLFSGVWAFLLLGEQITALHLGCAVLIVSGIFVANHQGRNSRI